MVLNQDEQRVIATFVTSNYFSELGALQRPDDFFDAVA